VSEVLQEIGVNHISVVSAQGANKNIFKVKWFHPLWYTYTLGMKESTVLEENDSIKHVSIFRPGMLDRLVYDRSMEKFLLSMGILDALKVSDLPKLF